MRLKSNGRPINGHTRQSLHWESCFILQLYTRHTSGEEKHRVGERALLYTRPWVNPIRGIIVGC